MFVFDFDVSLRTRRDFYLSTRGVSTPCHLLTCQKPPTSGSAWRVSRASVPTCRAMPWRPTTWIPRRMSHEWSGDDGPLIPIPRSEILTCVGYPRKNNKKKRHIFKAMDIQRYIYIYTYQEVVWPSTQLAASLDIDDTDYTIANSHHLLNRMWNLSWQKESQGCSIHVELKGKLCQIVKSFSWKVEMRPQDQFSVHDVYPLVN